ncbi:MAG: VC0807 family protein [Sciscionella sp.]
MTEQPFDDGGRRRRRNGVIFNIVVTVIDVVVAIVAFDLARRTGASEAVAYFIGCIGPLLGSLVVWLRARELSGASMAVLAFTVLSAVAVVVGSRTPAMLLYKDAVVTGLVGLIFAGSMLFPRPLAFYFGQRYGTDGTHQGMERFDQLWQYPLFRRAQYACTAVWAIIFLAEAIGKAYLIHSLGFDTAYTWTQILPFIATAVALLLTFVMVKHYRTAGNRIMAEHQHANTPPPSTP